VANAQIAEIEEIIVTAQKREQSIQDVSISVTALSGDMIDDFGYEDTRDIFYQTPNVDVSQWSYSGGITIRGNATLNNTLAGEGTVALYFDEVYRPVSFYGGNMMLDVERVEVLRGPQGTLFGRNSTAGLVHFISRKPTEEPEGYASIEYGSYDTRIFEGAISGPLSERVRGRLAVKYHEDDGFQTNQGPAGGKLAVTDRIAGRAHLEFDLNDDAVLLLSVEASDADDIGKAFNYWGQLDPMTLTQCEPKRMWAGECVGGGAYFGLPTFGDPDVSVKRPYTEHDPDNGDGRYTLETLSATAKLTWQLSETMELISITGYDSHERFFNTDEDASATGVWGGYYQYNDQYTSESDQFTQEIRLTGSNGGIDWLLGFFYFDEDRGATSTAKDFEAVPGVPDTFTQVDSESWAVFGEFGRSLTETVRLVGGLRYTDEKKETHVLTNTLPGSQQLSDDNLSFKAGLEWRPRDEWMVYGTISSSFRSGNFNNDLLFGNLAQLTAVAPEEVISFELGSKSTLMDGRMTLNATAFYQDATDKQGIVYDRGEDNPSPASKLITVGDMEIYGAELELYMVPVENLELSLGVGWLDTEIQADPGFGFNAGFGTGANAFLGDPFFLDGSGESSWGVNGMVRYHIPLASAGRLTLQADYDWRDESIGENGLSYNEDRLLVNLRAFWNSPDGRWEIQAYAENAFNKKYIDNLGPIVAGEDHLVGNMGLPQWFGVKVIMSF
jgi:iron complex outermembrane receptor protein